MRPLPAPRRAPFLLGALACAALSTFATLAHADETPADLVQRGVELRIERKDEEALALFRRAYAIAPEPRTRIQIGLAEQALGMWVAAEADLEAGLAAKDDPWVAKNAETIEEALRTVRSRLGSLEVRTNAKDAELFVDGASMGKLPLPRAARLVVGPHRIEVRAPGYTSSARSVEIASGAIVRETFELAPEAPESERSPRPAPPLAHDAAVVPDAGSTPGSAQRTLGWALVGVGVAAGAFSGASFALRDGAIRSYNDDATCPGRASPAQPPHCADKIDGASRWLTVGIAAGISAGMIVIGGLVVALTAPKHAGPRTASCDIGGCSVRF